MGDDSECRNLKFFDATHEDRCGKNSDRDRGVEAKRSGAFPPPLAVSYFVGKYILPIKKNRCTCAFSSSTGLVSRFATFPARLLWSASPRAAFKEEEAW